MQAWRSFGSAAADYELGRPGWPVEAVDAPGIARESTVLDLAAGTGKLTRALERLFAEVVAVEPDERMRAQHRGALAGSAEEIPLDEASVDAVFVGEAFHWFDPQAAIPELERVLRPRGGLAIVSTHWWETEPPLPDAALQVLSEPWERSQPLRRAPWDDAFDGSPFEQLRYERADDELTVDDETLLTLYSTTSSLAALPPEERASLFERVRPLLAGPYRLPLRHELVWTRLAR